MVWRLSSQPNMRARRAELVISTIRLFLMNLRAWGNQGGWATRHNHTVLTAELVIFTIRLSLMNLRA